MEKTKSKIVGISNSISRKNDKNESYYIPLYIVEKIPTLNEKKRYDHSDYKDDCRAQVTTKLFQYMF